MASRALVRSERLLGEWAGPATMTSRAVWGVEKEVVERGQEDGGTSHNGKPSRGEGVGNK